MSTSRAWTNDGLHDVFTFGVSAEVPSMNVEGRLLCRTTVNLSGAPHGSEVWVDPEQQLVRTYLRRGLLVPVTEPDHAGVTPPDAQEPAEPAEPVGTDESVTELSDGLLDAPAASQEAE